MLLDDFYLFGKGKVFLKESYDIIPFEFKEKFDKKNLNGIYQFLWNTHKLRDGMNDLFNSIIYFI